MLFNGFRRAFSTKLTTHQKELMARSLPKKVPLTGVENIIVVASGKGGVGKSTVAVNVAASLAKQGKRIGLLDGDIFGPCVPRLMNLRTEEPLVNNKNLMIPPENYGVKCLSMGMLTSPDNAIIWRGPLVMSAIQRLLKGADWGPLDLLIVDTPPGTGDVHLSLAQNTIISGVILVSTPHISAMEVTMRGAQMYNKLNVPIFGLVENMRYSICSNCQNRLDFFKGAESKCLENLEVLTSLPLDANIAECCESGVPVVIKYPNSTYASCFEKLAQNILNQISYNTKHNNKLVT